MQRASAAGAAAAAGSAGADVGSNSSRSRCRPEAAIPVLQAGLADFSCCPELQICGKSHPAKPHEAAAAPRLFCRNWLDQGDKQSKMESLGLFDVFTIRRQNRVVRVQRVKIPPRPRTSP